MTYNTDIKGNHKSDEKNKILEERKMSLLYLDVAQLTERANELETLNEQFLNEICILNEREEELAGMWEGEAKESFRRAYASDSIQMKNFYNAIRVYVQQLRLIIECYRRYEAFNSELARTRTYGGC